MIRLKRVYAAPSPSDGTRILVDRLWPRGLSKRRASVGVWRRDLAPSDGLRKWYGHDRKRFAGFRERYRLELLRQRDSLAELAVQAERTTVTLLHATRDSACSNAAVLGELLGEVLEGGPTRRPSAPRRAAHAPGTRLRT